MSQRLAAGVGNDNPISLGNVRIARALAALTASALTLSLLGACASIGNIGFLSNQLAGIGEYRLTPDGAEITVPALWAGKKPDGTPIGGIEPARLVVSTDGDSAEYEVHLADLEAKGAGPAWLAATSVASAFATIFVGADPATVDYYFEVTGAIDGPSAGGILTVGLIAAFLSESLLPTVTMTGTITADGTIGPVGGVPTKIEAAARQGFKTIVLPAALDEGNWAQGNEYTRLADSLGVRVVPVQTISEAYSVMTGNELEALDSSIAVPLTPEVITATRGVTEELLGIFEQVLQASPELSPPTRESATTAFTRAQGELERGNYSSAYGLAAFWLSRIERELGAIYIETLIAKRGFSAAKSEISALATEVSKGANRALLAGAKTDVEGLEQYFGLATTLGWASFAEVMMDGVLLELPNVESESVLIEMGRDIAEEQFGVSVMMPLALQVLTSVPTRPTETINAINQHLSAYSRFLLRASKDNETYLTDVLARDFNLRGVYQNSGRSAATVAASKKAALITPQVEGFSQEVVQASYGLTYFWLTSSAVASVQAYKVFVGADPDDIDAARQATMNAAVDTTWWFVESRATELEQLGVDASASVWAARWAISQAGSLRETDLATESDWLAQGELWYEAVHVMMMLSTVRPALIEAA